MTDRVSAGRLMLESVRRSAPLQETGAGIRSDFEAALSSEMTSKLGGAGTDQRKLMEKAYGGYLTGGKVDLSKLSEDAKKELAKLQKASEDFEAYMVKGLLAKMRGATLSGEESQMTTLAKDMMDQSVSEALARSQGSIGIAKQVFVSMGSGIVAKAAGAALGTVETTNK